MAKEKKRAPRKAAKRKMKPIIIDENVAKSWIDNPITWVAIIVLLLLLVALVR